MSFPSSFQYLMLKNCYKLIANNYLGRLTRMCDDMKLLEPLKKTDLTLLMHYLYCQEAEY